MYYVVKAENFDIIEMVNSIESGLDLIYQLEIDDQTNGVYVDNNYTIVEDIDGDLFEV